MRTLAAALVLLLTASAAPPPAGAILIFSHTSGYRHESIPAGVQALTAIARRQGLAAEHSEDPAVFAPARLRRYRAIVLLSTTTDPKHAASEWLVGDRRTALQGFVARGGGIVAVPAAADSHYHWPWYGRLIGGRFARHPAGTPKGKVAIVGRSHPAGRGLPAAVERVDEWYYFDDYDPSSTLLATLDPGSIGEGDSNPNPVAWARTVDGGRVFYTAMGHTTESYSEPFFLRHLEGGLRWAIARGRRRAAK